jgi:hypothetical protein
LVNQALRQALEAVRRISSDPLLHELFLREVLQWASEMDLDGTPPVLAQRIHGQLRAISGVEDPYRAEKESQNRMALSLLPELKARIEAASDPLALAVRLAIAGNVIDLGVHDQVRESDLRRSIQQALAEPLVGDLDAFRREVEEARSILYPTDNAGEIVLDRLLIEQLGPARVTVAVRGAPVLNDATRADARAAGLDLLAQVIDNGSDAPGTVFDDCSEAFLERLADADLILAKGQGNYETLSQETRNLFFLFKAKCPVVAEHAGVPLGAHVLARPRSRTVIGHESPCRRGS